MQVGMTSIRGCKWETKALGRKVHRWAIFIASDLSYPELNSQSRLRDTINILASDLDDIGVDRSCSIQCRLANEVRKSLKFYPGQRVDCITPERKFEKMRA